jgi:predicted Zn-dependent peptidase
MIEQVKLGNGLRIIMEHMPQVRTTSTGIWIGAGSRYEEGYPEGISHFIEHMVFKGTKKSTAKELAVRMDMLGGQVNAFTSKECTCFHAKCLDESISEAFSLLCELITIPLLNKNDIEIERGVIAEEISMCEDNHEDLVVEQLYYGIWKGSTLANPILGTVQSIEQINRESIESYMKKFYIPSNMVISIAGSFKKDEIIEMVERELGADNNIVIPPHSEIVTYTPVNIMKEKDIEQNHFCIGFDGVALENDDKYPLSVLVNVLGGGMSSRLFQTIREERGLCYSVYSFSTCHIGASILGVYCALNSAQQEEAMALVLSELDKIQKHGITQHEFDWGMRQIKSSMIMSNESPNSRMGSLGRRSLLLGKAEEFENVIKKLEAITVKDVSELASRIFNKDKMSVSIVGEK